MNAPRDPPASNALAVGRTRTQVRYSETDQMGFVYHANYLVYFEIGRTALIREQGFPYAELERGGLRLPVVSAELRFLAPAKYDDELEIETRLLRATGVRLEFSYQVRRAADGELLVEGATVLASIDVTGRPRRLPPEVRARLANAVIPPGGDT